MMTLPITIQRCVAQRTSLIVLFYLLVIWSTSTLGALSNFRTDSLGLKSYVYNLRGKKPSTVTNGSASESAAELYSNLVTEIRFLLKNNFYQPTSVDRINWDELQSSLVHAEEPHRLIQNALQCLGDPYTHFLPKVKMTFRQQAIRGETIRAGIILKRRLRWRDWFVSRDTLSGNVSSTGHRMPMQSGPSESMQNMPHATTNGHNPFERLASFAFAPLKHVQSCLKSGFGICTRNGNNKDELLPFDDSCLPLMPTSERKSLTLSLWRQTAKTLAAPILLLAVTLLPAYQHVQPLRPLQRQQATLIAVRDLYARWEATISNISGSVSKLEGSVARSWCFWALRALLVGYSVIRLGAPLLFRLEVDALTDAVAAAGVSRGDVLVSVGDRPVWGLSAKVVERLLDSGDAGDMVRVGLERTVPSVTPTAHAKLDMEKGKRMQRVLLATTLVRDIFIAPRVSYSLMPATTTGTVVASQRNTSARHNTLLGYVAIREFTDHTFTEVCNAIDNLRHMSQSQGVTSSAIDPRSTLKPLCFDGVVLDLRGNPGGPLAPALDVAALFVRTGAALTRMTSHGSATDVYRSLPAAAQQQKRVEGSNGSLDLKTVRLCVLVDGSTASASEILTAALRDHGRALVMGSRTLGKNRAQAVMRLSDGSGLVFTIREFRSPNDRSMAGGIVPDVEADNINLANIRLSQDGVWSLV